MTTRPIYDAIILGAGAAGLWCAGMLAGFGRRTLVIDHAAEPARKVRLSGGGKCNVTNLALSWEDYWGENPAFCRSALSRLTPETVVRALEEAGIPLEEREHGQIFCRRSAKDVIDKLLADARDCDFLLAASIRGVRGLPESGFTVETAKGRLIGRTVVTALGNAAWPQIGATTRGLGIAASFGHAIIAPRPALVGLVLPENSPLRGLQGISLNVSIRRSAAAGGKGKPGKSVLPADSLPLLFTHKGFSGPAGLQTSVYLEAGDVLSLDFLPGAPLSPLLDRAGNQTCLGLFKRLLPERLALALIPPELAGRRIAEISKAAREDLCRAVHDVRVCPEGTEGFRKAEAARGGVDTAGVSSRTMESALAPGLFFCGEVLDVVGRLGGFNLHWAFASAAAAAGGVAEALERDP